MIRVFWVVAMVVAGVGAVIVFMSGLPLAAALLAVACAWSALVVFAPGVRK